VLVALLARAAAERDRLDRDHAAQRRVLRPVHDAHRAAAELAQHAEAAEALRGRVRHHEPPKRRRRSRQKPPFGSGRAAANECASVRRSPALSRICASNGGAPGKRTTITWRPGASSISVSGGVRPRSCPSTQSSPRGLIASSTVAGAVGKNTWCTTRAETPRKRIAATPATAW